MLIPLPFDYELNLTVTGVLARIVYRWWWMILLMLIVSSLSLGFLTGLIPPMWRGQATLHINASQDALITLDGAPWQPNQTIYAGDHTLLVTWPDGRQTAATVSLNAGQQLSLDVPRGAGQLRVRRVPPAGPGMTISRIWWAANAWRVESRVLDPRVDGVTNTPAQITASNVQTVAVTADTLEGLPTLDAFNGIADDLTVGKNHYRVSYRPDQTGTVGGGRAGVVTIQGWSQDDVTIPVSQTITLLRFTPSGRDLLLGERLLLHEDAGEPATNLRIVRSNGPDTSILAVPGQITDMQWSGNGSGVVVTSADNQRVTLTMIRLAPTIASRVLATADRKDAASTTTDNSDDSDAAPALALLPRRATLPRPVWAWQGETVAWVAPNEQDVLTLWTASLQSMIPEHQTPFEALAIATQPQPVAVPTNQRIVTIVQNQVIIGQINNGVLLMQATLPSIPASPELRGQWSPDGRLLMLELGEAVWLVDTPE